MPENGFSAIKWIQCHKNGFNTIKLDSMPYKWIKCRRIGFTAIKMDLTISQFDQLLSYQENRSVI
jgi:hypothetical protein